MEGSCSTGQSPQWAVVPVEEAVLDTHLQLQTLLQASVVHVFLVAFVFSTLSCNILNSKKDACSVTVTKVREFTPQVKFRESGD
jgi:hypothetical protein